MIHGVGSDLPSFKHISLRPGLNILLADKSEGASARQSRNGAGKTSFIDLVHFIFGADANRESIFRSEALLPWTFEAQVDVGLTTVDVMRTGKNPPRIRIEGDTASWPIQPKDDPKSGEHWLSLEQWRRVLGAVFFDLSVDDEVRGRGLNFRSFFPYFARQQSVGGMQSPTSYASKQQDWQRQIAVSYLLGLDARIPQEFEEVRIRGRALSALRKASREGGLGNIVGSAADLRTQATIAEARARRLSEAVSTFNVIANYTDLEKEASALTRSIAKISDENTADRGLILQLEDALSSERPPATSNLE